MESAASQVMQIISFNLLLKITQSQVKEGLQGLSHCYCQGGTDSGRLRRAPEEEEELQQIPACWKCLLVRVTGWAGNPPEGAQGELELQGQQLLADLGAYTGTRSQGECLRCPLVTLSLLMDLFLVQDPKCFVAINYPKGEAVPMKPFQRWETEPRRS